MIAMNNTNHSRRRFLHQSSVLLAGLSLAKWQGFAATPAAIRVDMQRNTPQTLVNNAKLKLAFGEERMIMPDGLQPSMLCSKTGTLVLQSQISAKPHPQERIFYPFAVKTTVSRDGGNTWNEFPLAAGDNGVNIEGGIFQLKDGTILALETYVTPGDKPDMGKGLLYYSNDDYKTLQGPVEMTFNIPNANFYASADDGGRPHVAMRLHRRLLELPNGDLLTTIYGFMHGDNEPSGYEPKMMKSRVMLFRSKNKGRHWDFVSTVAAGNAGTEGFGEPVITRVNKGKHKGRLICFMRTGQELYESISENEGKTWSPAKPRVFANLDVRKTDEWIDMFKDVKRRGQLVKDNPVEIIGAVVDPDLIALRSGILVAAFGVRIPAKACWINPKHPWNGNYLAFSLDGGDTWSHVVRLTTGVWTTHYMAIEETPRNNEVFVVYDFGHWSCKDGRYTYGRPVTITT
jgi:hypothetical protein